MTGNKTVNDTMLAIKALDPDASLLYSEYTRQWYVSARIEIGDGSMLAGGAEHRDDPEEAVHAYFEWLISTDLEHYIVSKYHGHRREWRWNGAAFAECTREVALPVLVDA